LFIHPRNAEGKGYSSLFPLQSSSIANVDRYLIDSQALSVLFTVLSSPGVTEVVGQL